MFKRHFMKAALAAAVTVAALPTFVAPATAQTKLKWAHVYEVSEPFHK